MTIWEWLKDIWRKVNSTEREAFCVSIQWSSYTVGNTIMSLGFWTLNEGLDKKILYVTMRDL